MEIRIIFVFILLMVEASTQTNYTSKKQAFLDLLLNRGEQHKSPFSSPLRTVRPETCTKYCYFNSEASPHLCTGCICRKNYAKINSNYCHEAMWSKWSKWSKCIKTEWGGLQTRERVCKSLNRETPGSCDGRGSKSRTCTSVTGDFRIRKNEKDLTDEEVHDLIQAMTRLKKDSSKRGYRNIISWHGYPGRCPWNHKFKKHSDNHCSWHTHPLFLPWHRLITLQLELGLSRYLKNKTLGIPYWDWTDHSDDIPYLLRGSKIYDPVLKKRVHNPFIKTFIKYKDGHELYSQRNLVLRGLLNDKYMLRGTVRALLCHDYYNFDHQLSNNPHDQIHYCFCEGKPLKCTFGMRTTRYAAFDPAFFLHHSAIDRIYVMRRHLEESKGVSDWTSSRTAGEYVKHKNATNDIKYSFEWPLSPFCNKSTNPESTTSRDDVWTFHKSYYNEQLFGYKYDNLNLGNNYTWNKLLNDFDTNVAHGKFWHDEYFITDLGLLTKTKYSNPDPSCKK